jgi:hypothetical protein
MIVRHTDGDREFAYDQSSMSSLKQALVEAESQGWIVVDMQRDWQRVFAFESLDGSSDRLLTLILLLLDSLTKGFGCC